MQVSASGLGNASQQVLIEVLPPVPILHLNRVGVWYNEDQKVHPVWTRTRNPTQYDSHLSRGSRGLRVLRDLIISDIIVLNFQRPSEPPHYKLYGVLYHHDAFAGSGHHTVDVLHPNGNSDTGKVWLHSDDETVKPTTDEGSEWAAARCIEPDATGGRS